MNVECANWYFNPDDIFCPDCGREVALHGIPGPIGYDVSKG